MPVLRNPSRNPQRRNQEREIIDDIAIQFLPISSVKVTFVDRDGDEITVDAKIGDTLLEVAKEYDVDLEGKSKSVLSPYNCFLFRSHQVHARGLSPAPLVT